MEYKEFFVGDIFTSFRIGKGNNGILSEGEDCPYIGAKKSENGVMRYCGYDSDLIMDGNCILFICNGAGSVGYTLYMDRQFIATSDIVAGYAPFLTKEIGLYLVTILDLERPRYSYGRKWKRTLKQIKLRLPVDNNGNPDWEYIQAFMQSQILGSLPSRAKSVFEGGVKLNPLAVQKTNLIVDDWRWTVLSDLFIIEYGNSLELINLEETNKDDTQGVAFISRTATNNGIDAFVKPITGINPFPEGAITVALGGSVLSTFIQPRPFYTAFHIKVLSPLVPLSIHQKLFLINLIRMEAYRYSYGRQANATLDKLRIKLPFSNNEVDWAWIDNYMKSLPFSGIVE